jgi:hypothetical protein
MLLLGDKMWMIKGVSVFPDDANPNQFWYLPPKVGLVRDKERVKFTLIKYRPAASSGGAKGGGFLIFDVAVRIDPEDEKRIKRALPKGAGAPELTAVPFEGGTVKCVALDLEGGGGTTATLAQGAFQAVEKISGATNPSLGGDNIATFSLKLSQEGAIILEKAFRDATTPIGVIYDLDYRAMRPNLNVEITANMSRVYDHFSASLRAQYALVSGGIDAGLEKLKEDKVLEINVKNYRDEEDRDEKEKWALEFFKAEMLDNFFTPTLNPDDMGKRMAQAEPLDAVIERGTGTKRIKEDAGTGDDGDTDDDEGTDDDEEGTDNGEGDDEPKSTGDDKEKDKTTDADGGKGKDEPKSADDKGKDEPKTTDDKGKGKTDDKGKGGSGGTGGSGILPTESAALMSAATGMPVVSFQLKYMKQIEDKKLTFRYNRSSATKRQYRPQGSFGLMFADVQKDSVGKEVDKDTQLPTKYFVNVDLDHPFFRQYAVRVEAIPETGFDKFDLKSAIASIEYGSNPTELKTRELSFQKAGEKEQKFEAFLNHNLELDYRQSLTFNFTPGGEWEGSGATYRIPDKGKETSREGSIFLDPTKYLRFFEIAVKTSEMVWDGIKSVDVHLECTDASGWNAKKYFHLTSSTGDQAWKLRLARREEQKYTYRLVYNLTDGSTHEVGPVETDNPTVLVEDPFSSKRLTVKLKPVGIKWDKVELVLVTLTYTDPENRLNKSQEFNFDKNDQQEKRWHLLLKNPDKKTYQWRAEYYIPEVEEPRRKTGESSQETLPLRTPAK